jgi:citrate lyase beta subunit
MTASDPVTWLFVPATRPERLAKAFAAGAHAVIADLEDAVDAQDKAGARAHLDVILSRGPQPGLWVRINAVDTPWFAADLALVHQHRHVLAGVMLAKTESIADLHALDCEVPVLALIESARGMLALGEICQYPHLARLAFGSVDFCRDLGCQDDWDLLLQGRMQMVVHSAAARLPAPVDGVTLALDDADHAVRDATRAARLGFGGKLCIHPSQLAPVMQGFSPTVQQVQWATRVIALSQHAGSGAQRIDGQMVDRPVIERARAVLKRHLRSSAG